ncbi:MAG: membrane protein insertase YidC [Lentisphaerae bacterium]|nr:membrane protein insertase YidC [Lentisphaerota bacterium]
MNRTEKIIVVVIGLLMIAWLFISPRLAPQAPAPAPDTGAAGPAIGVTNAQAETGPSMAPAATPDMASAAAEPAPAAAEPAEIEEIAPRGPEQLFTLTNSDCALTFSSRGAGLVQVDFPNYRRFAGDTSSWVVIDQRLAPALVYTGLAGLGADADFRGAAAPDGASVTFELKSASGLALTRTITLDRRDVPPNRGIWARIKARSIESDETYRLKVVDVFSNAAPAALDLAASGLTAGGMTAAESELRFKEAPALGVDIRYASGGRGVRYWGAELVKLFSADQKKKGLPRPPESVRQSEETPVDWVAVKNKFFVQILAPENGAGGYHLAADRVIIPGEAQNHLLAPKHAELELVKAGVNFPETRLEPGGTIGRAHSFYAGPKKYSVLKFLGFEQDAVMEFGFWTYFCKLLLNILNLLWALIPNYGVAIILLTLLLKVVFWPLTRKSTESMKKMQEIQPLMAELKTRFKDNPKKQQEETLRLYKEHKVNPLGGCLPMLIQIPVFIALFVVLRSAIELRFAAFLWIDDLSQPERLFMDLVHFPVNLLPILMTVTMIWQQKLTPTGGDPAQQKMMMFIMPVMMLVMFYSMASGLVLYWTANQCVSIVQQLLTKYRARMKPGKTA